MKSNGEIQAIQGLANIAATLLSTGHLEAKDAAQPILSMIKSQFQPADDQAEERTVSLNVGETERITLREYQYQDSGPNPHFDPVAAATERLRLVRAEVRRCEADAESHGKASRRAKLSLDDALYTETQAVAALREAIDANNDQ